MAHAGAIQRKSGFRDSPELLGSQEQEQNPHTLAGQRARARSTSSKHQQIYTAQTPQWAEALGQMAAMLCQPAPLGSHQRSCHPGARPFCLCGVPQQEPMFPAEAVRPFPSALHQRYATQSIQLPLSTTQRSLYPPCKWQYTV